MDKIAKISENGLQFIKLREAFYSQPYLDVGGLPTIGYGTRYYPGGILVTMDDTQISREQAEKYLQFNCNKLAKQIDALVIQILNQNQLDSLISFCYNCGFAAFHRSMLLKRINGKKGDELIKEAFLMWNKVTDKATAKPVAKPGLTARRLAEYELYIS